MKKNFTQLSMPSYGHFVGTVEHLRAFWPLLHSSWFSRRWCRHWNVFPSKTSFNSLRVRVISFFLTRKDCEVRKALCPALWTTWLQPTSLFACSCCVDRSLRIWTSDALVEFYSEQSEHNGSGSSTTSTPLSNGPEDPLCLCAIKKKCQGVRRRREHWSYNLDQKTST